MDMKTIRILVRGEPIALKKHMSFAKNMGTKKNPKYVARQYMDPKARQDRQNFQAAVQSRAPEVPWTGPIGITFVFVFGRPQNHYGTGKNASKLKDWAPFTCTKKPDCTNLEKFIEDSMNQVFFKDDSQIVFKQTIKRYGESPRTYVEITDLSEADSRLMSGQGDYNTDFLNFGLDHRIHGGS